MKRLTYLFVLALALFSCQKEDTKTIYFVRHAEKDTLYPKDPALTIDGVMRSVDLATYFNKIKVDTIFSSDYKRTKETAQPLADKQGVGIGIYNPMEYEAFANTLKSLKADTIVVVGHSNTLLPQIEALGVEKPQAEIADDEYDKIFQVDLADEKAVVHEYGSKSAKKKDEQKKKGLNISPEM